MFLSEGLTIAHTFKHCSSTFSVKLEERLWAGQREVWRKAHWSLAFVSLASGHLGLKRGRSRVGLSLLRWLSGADHLGYSAQAA